VVNDNEIAPGNPGRTYRLRPPGECPCHGHRGRSCGSARCGRCVGGVLRRRFFDGDRRLPAWIRRCLALLPARLLTVRVGQDARDVARAPAYLRAVGDACRRRGLCVTWYRGVEQGTAGRWHLHLALFCGGGDVDLVTALMGEHAALTWPGQDRQVHLSGPRPAFDCYRYVAKVGHPTRRLPGGLPLACRCAWRKGWRTALARSVCNTYLHPPAPPEALPIPRVIDLVWAFGVAGVGRGEGANAHYRHYGWDTWTPGFRLAVLLALRQALSGRVPPLLRHEAPVGWGVRR
jgi:hypothetical protein